MADFCAFQLLYPKVVILGDVEKTWNPIKEGQCGPIGHRSATVDPRLISSFLALNPIGSFLTIMKVHRLDDQAETPSRT
jgi:hypothetical protein